MNDTTIASRSPLVAMIAAAPDAAQEAGLFRVPQVIG